MVVVFWLYLGFIITPILLLAVGSVGEIWTNTLLPHGLTGRWYVDIVTDPSFQRGFVTSITVSLATCVATAIIAVPFAYALYAAAGRGWRLAARILFLLPIAAPPLVLGFGFLLVFSSETLPWMGTPGLLIAGHTVMTLPYLLQTLIADMRHQDLATLERAAESLGATLPQRLIGIILPALRHSLASGLVLVAALSIGEFQLSNLIAGFLARPYPVVLLQAFYGATGFACAGTIVLLVLALAASLTSVRVGKQAATQRGVA